MSNWIIGGLLLWKDISGSGVSLGTKSRLIKTRTHYLAEALDLEDPCAAIIWHQWPVVSVIQQVEPSADYSSFKSHSYFYILGSNNNKKINQLKKTSLLATSSGVAFMCRLTARCTSHWWLNRQAADVNWDISEWNAVQVMRGVIQSVLNCHLNHHCLTPSGR